MTVAIAAADVKKLRELTNAPMMACKTALVDADGDMDKAAELVRERTGAKMDARAADRTAGEGLVHTYLHTPSPGMPAKVGVLCSCPARRTSSPRPSPSRSSPRTWRCTSPPPSRWWSEDQVDEALLEKEKEFARKEAIEQGKPENIIDTHRRGQGQEGLRGLGPAQPALRARRLTRPSRRPSATCRPPSARSSRSPASPASRSVTDPDGSVPAGAVLACGSPRPPPRGRHDPDSVGGGAG
jgi:elongation factor Ts